MDNVDNLDPGCNGCSDCENERTEKDREISFLNEMVEVLTLQLQKYKELKEEAAAKDLSNEKENSEDSNQWYCSECHVYHRNSESFNQCEEGHCFCEKAYIGLIDNPSEEFNIEKCQCPICVVEATQKIADDCNLLEVCPMCEKTKINTERGGDELRCACDACGFNWTLQYAIDCIYFPESGNTLELDI